MVQCFSYLQALPQEKFCLIDNIEVLSGLEVSIFSILSQAVTSVWVQLPQVSLLRTCPNIIWCAEKMPPRKNTFPYSFTFRVCDLNVVSYFI